MNDMLALFDIEEPTWTPVVRAYGLDLLSVIAESRCRDCGRKLSSAAWSHCCGGADARGIWEVCDDCAGLDGCLERKTDDPARHCSYWGIPHPAAEHQELADAQSKRRATYRRAHPITTVTEEER